MDDAARAVHVQNWRGLDPPLKRVGKLLISQNLHHALPPSAGDVLRLGFQDHFDTLSFPTEWTDLSRSSPSVSVLGA